MKRVLTWALIVCVAVSMSLAGGGALLAGGPAESFAASYPKPKPIKYKKTGKQEKDIIGFARSQIGYQEGRNNNTYFGHWYGLNYNPWCAMFVSWCAAKAGVKKEVLPRLASADRSWAKKQGVYYKSAQWGGSYTPKKGDLIYFSWSVRDYADHIGMVSGTGKKNGKKYVYTIEGNKHDKVVKGKYPLNNRYILGYASPKYNTDPAAKKKTYAVTYDAKGGVSAPPAQAKIKGTDLILSKKEPTKSDCSFRGWADKKDSKEVVYQPGDAYKKNKKVTLYAVWKRVVMECYVKVTLSDGINIRTGPGLSYDVCDRVPQGLETTVDKVKNGWGRITGTDNWIMLKDTKILEGYKVSVRIKNLNLRAGPGKTYEKKGKIKPGTYEISKINGKWGKVKAKGYWISLDYTKRIK